MALAVPKTANRPEEWMPSAEAARLLGVETRHARRLAADHAARGLARRLPPPSGKGKAIWWVHRSIDPRLDRCPSVDERDRRTRESLLTEYPLHKVDEACRKSIWMHRWRDACKARRRTDETEAVLAERVVDDARRAEGDDFAISERSLRLWRTKYEAIGPDGQVFGLRGLIDGRGEVPAGSVSPCNRSQEAIDYFYELYRTGSGLKVTTCHDMTLHEARQRGWEWPASISATRVWLRRCDDLSETCLHREGGTVWARKFLRHVETDWESVEPGQMYVSDHHQLDLWCWYQGRQIRPWLTAVQDMRSRVIVGWHLGPSPHQDAIIAALQIAFRKRAVPETIRIDNGRDYTSKLLTGMTRAQRDALRREHGSDWRDVVRREGGKVGVDTRWMGILTELGIRTVFAQPYHAWSKGTIERWFGTLESQFGRTFATYCGSSTIRRPEYIAAIRRGYTSDERRDLRRRHGKDWRRVAGLRLVEASAVPSLEEVRAQLGDFVTCYHAAEHQGDGMFRRSPEEVWSTASRLHRGVESEIALLCQGRGNYKVHGRGVSLRVGSGQISYGRTSPALARMRGREVFIALDSSDISYCLAYTADKPRRFLGRLDANQRIPAMTGVDDFREVLADNAREQAVIGKARRMSMRRAMDNAGRLRERRAQRAAELRATGTDNLRAVPAVVPVTTNFAASDGVSKTVRTGVETPLDAYDRELRLAFHRHLFGPRECEESPTLDETESTDAATEADSAKEPSRPTSKRKRPLPPMRKTEELWAEVHKEQAEAGQNETASAERTEGDDPAERERAAAAAHVREMLQRMDDPGCEDRPLEPEPPARPGPSVLAMIRAANERRGETETS